ncbi:MAG: glycoside hydrolase family 32 protein [Ethanoligenens sp.]
MNNQPVYHIFSPDAFINDPNGLLYDNGWYHVFYQWNPLFPEGKRIGWAHLRSTDLIHWEDLPPALLPDDWYDRNGCYSGSAIIKDGQIHLLYTGNVRNAAGNREVYQCLAVSEDGEHFLKYPGNPLISGPAEGYTAHFRDPKVFADKDAYAFVLGAQTTAEQGRVLLYRSPDLLSWKFDGALQFDTGSPLGQFGYMWECPNLFALYDTEQQQTHAILLFCPQGLQADGMHFANRFQCGYVVAPGPFEGIRTFCGCTSFEELDKGFEFYAPQVVHAGNRTLLMGWMGMPDEEDQPSKTENWMHCLTVPRELQLKNGKIHQQPAVELQALHGSKRTIEMLTLENESLLLPGFSGDCYDMQLTFDTAQAQTVTIYLRQNQKQSIIISFADGILRVDRSHSRYAPGNPIRQVALADTTKLQLRVLSDRSAMELFINAGVEAFALRTYLDEDAVQTKVAVNGKTTLTEAVFYSMNRT